MVQARYNHTDALLKEESALPSHYESSEITHPVHGEHRAKPAGLIQKSDLGENNHENE